MDESYPYFMASLRTGFKPGGPPPDEIVGARCGPFTLAKVLVKRRARHAL